MKEEHQYHIPGSIYSCAQCANVRLKDRQGKIRVRHYPQNIIDAIVPPKPDLRLIAIGPSLQEFIDGKATIFSTSIKQRTLDTGEKR